MKRTLEGNNTPTELKEFLGREKRIRGSKGYQGGRTTVELQGFNGGSDVSKWFGVGSGKAISSEAWDERWVSRS